MSDLKQLTPTQKLKSPFVATVVFWNKSQYQGKFKTWNFRSDMLQNINKNSTLQQHLTELIQFIKSDILKNYGFELCTIFENVGLLTQYENFNVKKNVVLQYSERSLYYDNRSKLDFDSIVKNNEFYISETWNEEVMLISFNKNFIANIQRSFKEQSLELLEQYKNTQNVYEMYRAVWNVPYQNNSLTIAN